MSLSHYGLNVEKNDMFWREYEQAYLEYGPFGIDDPSKSLEYYKFCADRTVDRHGGDRWKWAHELLASCIGRFRVEFRQKNFSGDILSLSRNRLLIDAIQGEISGLCSRADEGVEGYGYGLFSLQIAMLSVLLSGRKLYEISSELSSALLPENTRLSGCVAEHLRLPFGAIYFSLPHGVFVSSRCKDIPVGVYIFEIPYEGKRQWNLIFVKEREIGTSEADLGIVGIWRVPLVDGVPVEECLGHADRLTLGDGIRVFVEDERVFRFIMNVMMYITSQDAEVDILIASSEYRALYARAMKATGEKRKKLFGRLRKRKDGEKHILLGKTYEFDRKKRRSETESEKTGRKVSVRYINPGHWRNQPYGKVGEKKVYKRIWIKPHWKGPEGAPITSNKILVK